ncbi:MAG TPA: tRNA pseudouridine(38-40) synthase TruA [Acidimicrobiales bacterium]
MTLFGEQAGTAPPPAVIDGPTVRFRLDVAYLGAGFHGFAVQPNRKTVGGTLTAAIERFLRHTVELTCAGRTDRGVHAWGQVVSFDARADVNPAALQRSVNRSLAPNIVIRSAAAVADDFDARRSATGRRYRYSVLNSPIPDPFLSATAWHVAAPLDLQPMLLACDPLYGEHDFGSFCRRPPGVGASLVRRVRSAVWTDMGNGLLRFEIEASSFCQQMVRSLVGTMVDIGMGKRRAGEMAGVLRARDRAAAGQLAPPHGLCLWNVTYQ